VPSIKQTLKGDFREALAFM